MAAGFRNGRPGRALSLATLVAALTATACTRAALDSEPDAAPADPPNLGDAGPLGSTPPPDRPDDAEPEAMPEPEAAPAPAAPPPAGAPPEVQLWRDSYQSGPTFFAGPGEYPNLASIPGVQGNWTNTLDSIRIPPGVMVTAWSHPDFAQRRFGPLFGPAQIAQVPGKNDWDSMKIELVTEQERNRWVEFHEHHDFSGGLLVLEVGEYPDLNALPDAARWRNKITSVRVPPGLQVRAWSHPNFTGGEYGPFVGAYTLRDIDGHDDWDSVTIEPAP
jgi:hypothetical protein